MEDSDQYCPDCIVKFKRESKKLGQLSVWLICSECGYRIRPIKTNSKETYEFIRDMKEKNKNLTKFDEDE